MSAGSTRPLPAGTTPLAESRTSTGQAPTWPYIDSNVKMCCRYNVYQVSFLTVNRREEEEK
jgi:hypothetical protein